MLLIYADKSKLSSFGTQKGYPVIARCANLPVELRNGNGIGGGRVVGWLPIVCSHWSRVCLYLKQSLHQIEEEAGESGKAGYVDFKRVVWHEAFYEVLATISELSRTGQHVKCGDGIDRHVFPAILILSADYEEQYVLLGLFCSLLSAVS